MSRARKGVFAVLALLLLANVAYFVKATAGLDLDRRAPGRGGHHGQWFPLGDWLWRKARGR